MNMDMVMAVIVLYGLRPSQKDYNLSSLAPVIGRICMEQCMVDIS